MFPDENEYKRDTQWRNIKEKRKKMPPRNGNKAGSLNSKSVSDLFDEEVSSELEPARWSNVSYETLNVLTAACDNLGASLTLAVTRKKDAYLVVIYHNEKQNKRYFTSTGEGLLELHQFAVALLERSL